MRFHVRAASCLLLWLTSVTATAAQVPADSGKWSRTLGHAVTGMKADETVTVWIYFTDKGENLQAKLYSAEARLSERARARRLRHRDATGLVDHLDVPVEDTYIRAVTARVERVRHRSRWLNAVSAEARAAALGELARLPFVRSIDVVRSSRSPRPEPETDAAIQQAPRIDLGALAFDYGASLTQISQINAHAMHALGYNGSGVLICMLDTGFNNLQHEALDHLDILETRDFVNGDSIVWDEAGQMGSGNHGTYTLSAAGGFQPGQLIGPAWGASYILGKTENTEWERHIEEDWWIAGAEWADGWGADIISSSLGYLNGFSFGEPNYTWQDMDGNTTVVTIGADIAASRGIIVVNSAGNNYEAAWPSNTLIGPADGDSVFAIGAVDASGARALFSSTGPTADGRTKPDVMAMGVSTRCCSPTDPTGYFGVSGTSLSCPLVAGAAALLLEAHPTLTNIEIMDALRNTASQAGSPDHLMGWGIVDVAAAAATVTAIGDRRSPAAAVQLFPAVPNPFNPATTLRYELPVASRVTLEIFDVAGRRVATLVDRFEAPGTRSVRWNGRNGSGASVSSGIYVYRIRAAGTETSSKMVLLK